jgi:guanine nucleotide-binding protein subunit alpha
MGNCLSNSAGNDGSPESLKSRQLDRLLRDDEKRMVKEVKLLLLGESRWAPPQGMRSAQGMLLSGAGESGKSTILKVSGAAAQKLHRDATCSVYPRCPQSMRLIHHIPFTAAEREHYRRLVFVNLVQGMKLLLDAIEEWGGHFEHPEYAVSCALWQRSLSIAVLRASGRRRIETDVSLALHRISRHRRGGAVPGKLL